MATYNKFNQTVEDYAHGVHNNSSDQFVVALTNSAPVAANSVLTDITEISYTNLSTRNLTTSTSSETAGTYTLLFSDLVLTSTGGATGPFRYVVIYNDTPTSPANPLISFYDYGSALTLNDGEALTIDFTGSTFTLV